MNRLGQINNHLIMKRITARLNIKKFVILVIHMNTDSPNRKRGRPRRQSESDQEMLRQLEIIAARREYQQIVSKNIYVKNIEKGPICIQSRAKNHKLSIITRYWDEDNEQIKKAIAHYEELKQSKQQQHETNDNIINSDAFEYEEEEEEEEFIEEFLLEDNKKPKAFKPPINEFIEEGFNKLSIENQNILRENHFNIFQNGLSYQEQILLTSRLIRQEPVNKCSLSKIGALFGVKKATISSYISRDQKNKKSHGRPRSLSPEQLRIVYDEINILYSQNRPPDIDMLVDIIFEKFTISILPDTLYRLIKRSKNIKLFEAPVMESKRADVPLEVIKEHYIQLNNVFKTTKVPPCFVFNVDESGFLDFVDIKKHTVILPVDAPNDFVLSVDRTYKRTTMIGCISLDGTKLKPFVIVPNKRVEKTLLLEGYNESNVIIYSQENGFINSELFYYWAEEVLVPEIERRRKVTGYEGEAILLLDGCSAHSSEIFLQLCTWNNIYPFFEPAGTSDQVQALDLGIFGLQKHF